MLGKRVLLWAHRKQDAPVLWGLPPTASLQEPEGIQVTLSAVVRCYLQTHRSGWGGEGLALPPELCSQARDLSSPGSHPCPACAPQEAPQQDSRTPCWVGMVTGPQAGQAAPSAALPTAPCHLPPLRLLGGGSCSRLFSPVSVPSSGQHGN